MKTALRRPLIGLLCLLAIALVASFAVWRWATAQLEQGFANWTRQAAASGWTVHAGALTQGGWPFAAALAVDDFAMTADARLLPGGAAYAATRLTLRLDARNPAVLRVLGEGTQSLRVGANPPQPFTADRFTLSIPLAQGAPVDRAALDAGGLRFAAPAEGLTIGLLEGQADWHPGAPPTINFRVSAEAITLPPPPARQPPLGPHVASATVEGTLTGTLPPDAQNPAAAAAAWRDHGGALALRSIALGWGPLGVTGSAALTLDPALQPAAQATLRLVGMDETLTALAAAHAISPRAAQAAKAVAGLLSYTPDGGGAAGVEVPVTLQDRTVSLGMIPLATVEKLNWPDGP